MGVVFSCPGPSLFTGERVALDKKNQQSTFDVVDVNKYGVQKRSGIRFFM